jgi:hypothetical protein
MRMVLIWRVSPVGDSRVKADLRNNQKNLGASGPYSWVTAQSSRNTPQPFPCQGKPLAHSSTCAATIAAPTTPHSGPQMLASRMLRANVPKRPTLYRALSG